MESPWRWRIMIQKEWTSCHEDDVENLQLMTWSQELLLRMASNLLDWEGTGLALKADEITNTSWELNLEVFLETRITELNQVIYSNWSKPLGLPILRSDLNKIQTHLSNSFCPSQGSVHRSILKWGNQLLQLRNCTYHQLVYRMKEPELCVSSPLLLPPRYLC